MQLKKSEQKDRELYTGFFSAKVLAVNPSNEQLAKLIGYEYDDSKEEMKYESKNDKGEDVITVSFWLQADTPEKQWFNVRHRLVDKQVISEKEVDGEKTSKTQYVNQTGGSSWCDKKENLLDWFSHYQRETEKGSKKYENVADKQVREAIQGEAGLYEFLTKWLSKVNWYDVDTNILIDVKRMFRNIDKYVRDEYQPLIDAQIAVDTTEGSKKSELKKELLTDSVVCLAVVYSGEKDGQIVHYQNVYGNYLTGFNMKKVSFALSTNNWNDKSVKKFHEQLVGSHGCKDSYTLSMLQPFDPNNHQQATNQTMKVADTVEDTEY